MPTKSGKYWVDWANVHAKRSISLDDLHEPFQTNAKAFIAALQAAGATVVVDTTFHSDLRAYLFHWCWLIGLGKVKPSAAKANKDADILWDHGDAAASISGAKEMIKGFGLAVPPKSTVAPALGSNHGPGTAVDMTITWTGTLEILDKKGKTHKVPWMEHVNSNLKLHAVGASYAVKKLTNDAPHWSATGH